MNKNKKIKLFISSTFSDFKQERQILQRNVFPYLKKYAASHGYSFQPIDLRWGVNNEAQLDQKTLEICLKEVESCKKHIHPNFLIMIGDRYGWVPLPNKIESDELESLNLTNDKCRIIYKWYKKDYNHLPVSYILQERAGEYTDFTTWEAEENELRAALQKAVLDSDLMEHQKRKYFLSATEAEAEEGIVSYGQVTQHQHRLLTRSPVLSEIDIKHTFAFIRNIDTSIKSNNNFINSDYKLAQDFKQRLEDVLCSESILNVTTKQLTAHTLNESYLKEFEERVTEFIKVQIDFQIKQEKHADTTALDTELSNQKVYFINKLTNFVGQQALLNIISGHILSDNTQPLICYGKSGSGKSSLIAKSIEANEKNTANKVFYRFIGATKTSNTSRDILISIIDEFYFNEITGIPDHTVDIDQESFGELSERFKNILLNINENVVLFIDAVDQLQNDDRFHWLPTELPSNIKVIITALDDDEYIDDSTSFKHLKRKTDNRLHISSFKEPTELLNRLLTEFSRTLTTDQLNYFLNKFKICPSPLYLNIVANEIAKWSNYAQEEPITDCFNIEKNALPTTQQEAITEFIHNLYLRHHHSKVFIDRILGYLLASKDGLSETEILNLITYDDDFIKINAPEEWHDNVTREVPLIHWSRLHAQLKPFLKVINQDNEDLISFHHREFVNVISHQPNIKKEHESIIAATQAIIKKNLNNPFSYNRWGKLYVKLVVGFFEKYQCDKSFTAHCTFLSSIFDEDIKHTEEWLDGLVQYFEIEIVKALRSSEFKHALIYANFNYKFSNSLKKSVYPHSIIMSAYLSALQNKAYASFELNQYEESEKYYEELFTEFEVLLKEPLPELHKELILNSYIGAINNRVIGIKKRSYIEKNQLLKQKVVQYEHKISSLLNGLNTHSNESILTKVQSLINHSISLYDSGDHLQAIEQSLGALKIIENPENPESHIQLPNQLNSQEMKLDTYINLIMFYSDVDREMSIKFGVKAHVLAKKLFNDNPDSGFQRLFNTLKNLALVSTQDFDTQKILLVSAELLIVEKFNKNPITWADEYARLLMTLYFFWKSTSGTNFMHQYLMKIIDISEKYDLKVVSHDVKKEYLGLFGIINDCKLTLPLVGYNCYSDDIKIDECMSEIKKYYCYFSSIVDFTNYNNVDYIKRSSPNFEKKLIPYLVNVANVAIIAREKSNVSLAHELSEHFMDTCIHVSDDNIKALEFKVSRVFLETKMYEKSKFL